METHFLLAQKNVSFHGIWKPRNRVSESLIKSIGASISTTPSRPCKLLLTSKGMTLILQPSEDGKKGKTDQIPFDSISDIIINQHNTTCLLVIYTDPDSKINVLAFTSQETRDLNTVVKTYNIQKNRNKTVPTNEPGGSPEASLNWTLRQKVRHHSGGSQLSQVQEAKSNISNGAAFIPGTLNAVLLSQQYGHSQRSDSNESYRRFSGSSDIDFNVVNNPPVTVVHDPQDLPREPAVHSGQKTVFNIGIQAQVDDADFDTDSVHSSTSIQVLRDEMLLLTEEMKAIKFLLEKSTGISAEEYHRRKDNTEARKLATHHAQTTTDDDSDVRDKILEEVDHHHHGSSNNNKDDNRVPNGYSDKTKDYEDDDYDLRSIGTQVFQDSDKTLKRYAKKNVKIATINANKERMAALRTRSSSAGPRIPTLINGQSSVVNPNISSSALGSSARSYSSSIVSQKRVVNPGGLSHLPPGGLSRPASKAPLAMKTTVVRPIQNVYQGKLARRPNNR